MKCKNPLDRKAIFGLMLMIPLASPAFSGDYAGVVCIDVAPASTSSVSRPLELSATVVKENFFSLTGSHMDQDKNTIGMAVGSAQVTDQEVIVTVNASSAVDTTMKATQYQFNVAASTLTGTFHSLTQESISRTLVHDSGKAAIVTCDAPLTSFAGTTPPTDPPTDPPPIEPPTACYDNDFDWSLCPAAGGNDCNDSDPKIKPGAPEICGDGIDQNCDGKDDACSSNTDPYPQFTSNGDQTLSQVGTNLVWQQGHYDPTAAGATAMNWYGAFDYCDRLTLAGNSNWRLPTKGELTGILDDRRSPVMINALFTASQAPYWTSTTATEYSVYDVHFGTGLASIKSKQTTSGLVRCVR